jgi:hypothetical protein
MHQYGLYLVVNSMSYRHLISTDIPGYLSQKGIPYLTGGLF